jgi:hypothetical protein
MANHSFTLMLLGAASLYDLDDAAIDRLYEAGCGDALLSSSGGIVKLDFDREASSFVEALSSAQADVKRAGYRSRWLLEED